MYNFDDYDIEDFKLCNLDFYYKDGRPCKILDYDWAGDGKYTYVNNIVICFDNGEIKEDVDKLKDTIKVASELFLDLHRAMTIFDALSDEIELD